MPKNNTLKLAERDANSPEEARRQVIGGAVAAMHAAFASQSAVVSQAGLPPDVLGVTTAFDQRPSQISGIPLPLVEKPLADVIPLTPGIVGATVENPQADASVMPEAA